MLVSEFALHKFKWKFRIMTLNLALHLHKFCSYTPSDAGKVGMAKHRLLGFHQLSVGRISDLHNGGQGEQFSGSKQISKLVLHTTALQVQKFLSLFYSIGAILSTKFLNGGLFGILVQRTALSYNIVGRPFIILLGGS